jgi:hypothetical protein
MDSVVYDLNYSPKLHIFFGFLFGGILLIPVRDYRSCNTSSNNLNTVLPYFHQKHGGIMEIFHGNSENYLPFEMRLSAAYKASIGETHLVLTQHYYLLLSLARSRKNV